MANHCENITRISRGDSSWFSGAPVEQAVQLRDALGRDVARVVAADEVGGDPRARRRAGMSGSSGSSRQRKTMFWPGSSSTFPKCRATVARRIESFRRWGSAR